MTFSQDFLREIVKDIEEASRSRNKDHWCATRDIFQARVDSYAMESKKYLGAAVIGEIGNNTFDHNWDFAQGHSRGTYLRLERERNLVVLADFGRGIRQSLKAVFDARDDENAVEVAFTRQISGRAPEQRGNGLRFVLESVEFLKHIIKDIGEKSRFKCKECWCSTRDVLQARIDSYAMETERYLGAAVIGEIGNNTFDHNWDFAEGYSRGTYLKFEEEKNMVILADFGRGIRQSLKTVFDAKDDENAVEVAFTQQISGRAPEQRGNGLKFVLESVASKKWSMYYQSGNGCCIVDSGNVIFTLSKLKVVGPSNLGF